MTKYIFLLLFISLCICSYSENKLIKVEITDSAKARKFDEKYMLVLPIRDYKDIINYMFNPQVKLEPDTAVILLSDIYVNRYQSLSSKRDKKANAVWITPLSYDSTGFLYQSNDDLINFKYNFGTFKSIPTGIGKDLPVYDTHSAISDGDSIYYYATTKLTKKRIYNIDTAIVDFDFYSWNENNKQTSFLFSASQIIPDSLLDSSLFSDFLYKGLDIYHWNWMQKNGPNKLLLNFAFCGFMQYDINTKKLDWYWGGQGHSFSSISGPGSNSNPYYTHNFNKISSGPYAGCYSYFENGGILETNIFGIDTTEIKPARARIFSLDPKTNSCKIEKEIVYDVYSKREENFPSTALGSVDVMDKYILVNTGMTLPLRRIMKIKETYGMDSARIFWKNWPHYNVFLYDLEGNEIARYSFPFGFYSYSSWLQYKSKALKDARSNNSDDELSIYINGSGTNLYVNAPVDKIVILDKKGKHLLEANTTKEISLSGLKKGDYNVELYKGTKKSVKKFSKD